MTKAELKELVEKMIAENSCCGELKEAGRNYLDDVDTAEEASAYDALIKELKEDVCTIDDVIPFFGSDHAKELFGKELAEQLSSAAKSAKEAGKKWCICGACTAGGAILDSLDENK